MLLNFRHPERALRRESNGSAFPTVFAIAAILALSTSRAAIAATKPGPTSTAETRTARALDEATKTGPATLRGFLYAMPKGADLHMHLTGSIYAESFIRAAGEDGLCIDTTTLAFVKPAAETKSLLLQPGCGQGQVRADTLAGAAMTKSENQHLYDQLIDSFSMRAFVPVTGASGHDHFFDSFAKFGGTSRDHLGEWLDEVASRAASQNEQYLEVMHTPRFTEVGALAEKV